MSEAKTRRISDMLKTHQTGDMLSDDECARLAEHMEKLEALSFEAGERFVLQAAYAGQVARDCRHFLHARKQRRLRYVGELVTTGVPQK